MSSIEVRGHNFGAISVKAEIDEHFVNHKSELPAKINMARELVSAAYDILYSINRSDDEFNVMIRVEIRKNDRDFKKGDTVILRETVHSSHRMASHNAPLEYTGRTMKASISSLYGYYNVDGIEKGFVVFGLTELTIINYEDDAK